jgi:hypothetical protein
VPFASDTALASSAHDPKANLPLLSRADVFGKLPDGEAAKLEEAQEQAEPEDKDGADPSGPALRD